MYELLWRNKSHLFACSVTALAYSCYAADYNYTEEFVITYEAADMRFYINKESLAKRIMHARTFFSQKPNHDFYFAECANLKNAYSSFYNALPQDFSSNSNEELSSLFSTLLHLQARCASLYQGTHEYATTLFQEALINELKKSGENWQENLSKIAVETPEEIKQEEADYAELLGTNNSDLLSHVKKHPWVCGKAFFFSEAVDELKQLMKTRKPRILTENRPLLGDNSVIAHLAGVLRRFSVERINLKTLLQSKLLGSALYEEIARRLKTEGRKLFYTFDADDIITKLEGKETTMDNLRIYWRKTGVVEKYGEAKIREFKAKLEKKQLNTVSGMPVYSGKAKGTARIILPARLSELNKVVFNEGDILVTTMTNPNMLFLASKAGGIVTDEGGITCHAAIIARELKKPCIVGTRNATKILSEGDEVEVNAVKGIVTPQEDK